MKINVLIAEEIKCINDTEQYLTKIKDMCIFDL